MTQMERSVKSSCTTKAAALALVAFYLALAPHAAAGPKDEDLKSRRAQAAKLHEEGAQLFTKGDYEGARAKFREAYARGQNPNSLLNQAEATIRTYHYLEAAALLKSYLALPENDKVTASDRRDAQALLDQASTKLCALDLRALSCKVDGTPGQGLVLVEVGEHLVRMQGPKGEKLKPVKCAANETVVVTYEDPPADGPPLPAVPSPGPVTPPPAEAGEKGSWLLPGVLAGVGLVGLGVGATFHFVGVGSRDDATGLQRSGVCADRASAGCVALSDKLDAASTQRTVSAVGLIGGSAALGAAVVSVLIMRPWETRPRTPTHGFLRGPTLAPTFAPGYSGASISGSF